MDRYHVDHAVLFITEPHDAFEHIRFDQVYRTIFCFYGAVNGRDFLVGIHVNRRFVIYAAFELGTLARQFLRIERQVLYPGRLGCYRSEIGHPPAAAEFLPANAQTTYQTGFLPCPELSHFNAYAEFRGKEFDQAPEINPFIGYVVKNGLGPVPLELHISNFHLQAFTGRYLPGTDHHLVLSGNGFLPFFQVQQLGFPVDFLEFVGLRVDFMAFHLFEHKRPGQADKSYIVAGSRFYGNNIPDFQEYVGVIFEETLMCVFETDLEQVIALYIPELFHPVESCQFAAAVVHGALQIPHVSSFHLATA